MTEREQFEKVHCRNNRDAIRRNEVGDYVLPSIQDAYSGFLSGLEAARATPALPQGVEEWMPILGTCLAIPMSLLDESQAKSTHGQTPERLKERGGISLSEAAAIAGKRKWRSLESKRALEVLHVLSGMAIVPAMQRVTRAEDLIDSAFYFALGSGRPMFGSGAWMRDYAIDSRSGWIVVGPVEVPDRQAMLAAAKEKQS